MHERTSRALARLLFVGCCAIPTLLTVVTIMVTWTPWYHQRCLRELEAELSSSTGLSFVIEDFERRTPQRMELLGVQIRHPETHAEVLSVASLTWQVDPHANVLQVRHPELQASQIESAVRLLHDRYLCDPGSTSVPLNLMLDGFTIHDGGDSLTFESVDVDVTPRQSTVLVRLKATLAGDLSGRTIRADATRDRSGKVPVTNWHLSTEMTEIPCSVLSPYIERLAHLGETATFSGEMGCEMTEGRPAINLGGANFYHIDLTRLTQDWPQRLSGYADVNFTRYEVDEDQSHYVVGKLVSRDGSLQSGWIEPLEKHFGWRFADDVRERSDIEYSLMCFNFTTDGRRIDIGAMCNRDRNYSFLDDDTLICNGEKAIARMSFPSTETSVPAANLTYLLAPPQSPLVPFTPHAEAMLHWLLPDPIAPRDRILRIGQMNENVPPDHVIRMR